MSTEEKKSIEELTKEYEEHFWKESFPKLRDATFAIALGTFVVNAAILLGVGDIIESENPVPNG